MDYFASVRWLYGLEPRGIRLELDRMRTALALRGDPQRSLRVVHVAGTNGKGSVSAMVAAALRAAGLRVGLYTSPHLHRFVERIRVDGRPLGERALARRVTALRAFLESPGAPALTFFEVATLLAFEVFRDARVDVVVLEVGLGGRLDATNVIEAPLACAITRIARDHEAYLGDTLAKIALEKTGIVKPGVPLVVGARDAEARGAIAARAQAVGAAPVLRLDEEIRVHDAPRGRLAVQVGEVRIDALRPALVGAHQHENVAVAVGVLVALRSRGIAVSDDAIRAGIARVRWPGRLERVTRGGMHYVFDAAHNPDGCVALGAALAAMPRRGTRVLLFAAMRDKDHAQMLATLAPHCDAVVHTRPETPRAAEPEELAASYPGTCVRDVSTALRDARELAGKGGTVVVAGSIYLLAVARAAALGVRTEPPIAM
jgi:dihydrofolate synthase/folylpolyglutamate synthase